MSFVWRALLAVEYYDFAFGDSQTRVYVFAMWVHIAYNNSSESS